MIKFPIKLSGAELNLLVSVQGNSVLLTGCHCDQFLYPEEARYLAEVLCAASDQVEYEMKFSRKYLALKEPVQ